jgi:hypothetical protein
MIINRTLKGIILTLVLLSLALFQTVAQEEITPKYRWGLELAYYFPNQGGLNNTGGFEPISYDTAEIPATFTPIGTDEGRKLGNGWGAVEFQGWVDGSLTIPFLQGSGALTRGNNLKITEKINLSPVTAGSTTTFTLTPIAFLNFQQGNHLGTGWNAPIANGLGLNVDGTGKPNTSSFPGIVYKGWFSGTFQFDFAEVMAEPTEWSHVVVTSNAKMQYQVFSAANNNQPWQYEADGGDNYNGFRFSTSSLLGIMIPHDVINFAGFKVDTSVNMFDVAEKSTVASGGWGSDFTYMNMSLLINWQMNEDNSMIILAQVNNAPEYTAETRNYNYFVNRSTTGSSYFYFNRIAISYTMNL